MIPTTRNYTTLPASKISTKISETRPEFPTVVSDLISHYAVSDFSAALKPLKNEVDDPELNQAIKVALTSPICDPQLKVEIIYQAIRGHCEDKLRLLVAELLDSGQDVYLNNTEFDRRGCHLAWLFLRKELIGTSILLPNFGKVHFTGARLSFVFMECAYLPGAIFKGAEFDRTGLSGAFLYGADFSETEVSYSNFEKRPIHSKVSDADGRQFFLMEAVPTNLSGASFVNSDIARSEFSGAILNNTNFTGAKNKDRADFYGTDLSGITLFDPAISDAPEPKWEQIYVHAYNKIPTEKQLKDFSSLLGNYQPDQLLHYAGPIGKLGERLSDFVTFSKLPGGQQCDKNLFLIAHGIVPSELATYNQLRAAGKQRQDAIELIKKHRPVP